MLPLLLEEARMWEARRKLECWAKSSRFVVSFRVINRMVSGFIFLQWFKLSHICIEVTSLLTGEEFESISIFLMGNRFHVTLHILSPKSCKQCLSLKCWKAKIRAEKASKLNAKSQHRLRLIKDLKVCIYQIIAFAAILKYDKPCQRNKEKMCNIISHWAESLNTVFCIKVVITLSSYIFREWNQVVLQK